MMKAASIRPASRNILVCSSFISSGWRAADSRYLLPMMPMPMQAPQAPRPMIRPAARATKLMSSMLTPRERKVRGVKRKGGRRTAPGRRAGGTGAATGGSVRVVGLSDVDERQHHEHEGLQGDDQDVEDGPHRAGDDVQQREAEATGREREG